MIQLPDNWRDTIRVIPENNALILAYVNAHREFFMYFQSMDKAFTIDELVEKIANDYPNGKAHTLGDDLQTNWVDDPSDQDWKPLPQSDMKGMSLKQYQAHMQLAGKEDEAARQAKEETERGNA